MLTISLLAYTAPTHVELIHSSRVSRATYSRLIAAHTRTLRAEGVPYRLTDGTVFYARDNIAYAYGITAGTPFPVATGRAAIA